MQVERTTSIHLTGEDLMKIFTDKKLIAGNEQIVEIKVSKGDKGIKVVLELPNNIKTVTSLKKLENLSISGRLRFIFERENITSLDMVTVKSEREFSKISGIGPELLNEVKSLLVNNNLSFKQ